MKKIVKSMKFKVFIGTTQWKVASWIIHVLKTNDLSMNIPWKYFFIGYENHVKIKLWILQFCVTRQSQQRQDSDFLTTKAPISNFIFMAFSQAIHGYFSCYHTWIFIIATFHWVVQMKTLNFIDLTIFSRLFDWLNLQ